jgi:hypothetical protein
MSCTVRSTRPSLTAERHDERHLFVPHGAAIHARQAGRAGPDLLFGDDVADKLGRAVAVLRLQPLMDHVLLDFLNNLLGLERTAGGGRRARAVAPSALGAGESAEELLPGEFLPAGSPGRKVLPGPAHAQVAHGARGALAEEHVEGRREQVQVLGVWQVHEEKQHHDHVQPPHAVGEGVGGFLRHGRKGLRQQAAKRRPHRSLFAHEAEGTSKHHGQHQQTDQSENQVGVQAEVQIAGGEAESPGHGHAERDQHQHREDLQEEADDLDPVRVGDRQEREQAAHQGPVEASRVDDEAPEDEKVGQTDAAFVEDARL